MTRQDTVGGRVAYERCPSCKGSGLALNTFSGEPDECRDCDGGLVRARDSRGRFNTRAALKTAGGGE